MVVTMPDSGLNCKRVLLTGATAMVPNWLIALRCL